MDLLTLTKPKTFQVDMDSEIVETKVTELDSGNIINYTNKADKTDKTDKADKVDLTSSNTIMNTGVYSYCYVYLEKFRGFNEIRKKSIEHAKKYTDYIKYIQYQNIEKTCEEEMDYYESKYKIVDVKFKIYYTADFGESDIIINDKLCVNDDTLVVPDLYDFIADDLANMLKLKFIQIDDIKRLVRPTNKFKILFTNKLYCDNCLFKNSCYE